MADQLADQKCVPCHGGVPRLTHGEVRQLSERLPQWQVSGTHHIEREYLFEDFVSALAFVNRAGAVAEEQGHHPDIFLAWGKVKFQIYTHAVQGLTESDFILGAKIERLTEPPASRSA